MSKFALLLTLLISIVLLSFFGCAEAKTEPPAETAPTAAVVPPILKESWDAYIAKFIQQDGRVIDHKASGITTSEGQAYAMLRAVWVGDRTSFDKTFQWA